MKYTKTILILLMSVTLVFAACQTTPPETTTPPTEVPPQTPEPITPPAEAQSVTVNGELISAERITQVQQELGQFTGEAVTTEQATQYLIEERLLLQEAQRRGLVPTREEVEAGIEEQLQAQGTSTEEFRETLSDEEYEQLLEQQAQQQAIQALQRDVAPEPTEEEINEVYEQNRELFEAEGISEEEAREDIIAFLAQTQSQEALQQLIDELLATADIQ